MTAEEMQSVIVYLTDKVEKLEQQKLCECGKNEVSTPEYKQLLNKYLQQIMMKTRNA
jgi:hypothetical protein